MHLRLLFNQRMLVRIEKTDTWNQHEKPICHMQGQKFISTLWLHGSLRVVLRDAQRFSQVGKVVKPVGG